MGNELMTHFDERNRLMTKLLWFSLILGIISNFVAKVPMIGVITFTVVGILAALVVTIATYISKKFAPYVQYLIIINFSILLFFMVSTSPKLSNYMMIYVLIAFMTLYHNYRSIAFASLAGFGLSNYFFITYNEQMFFGAGYDVLISLNVMFIVITATLIAQARIGEKMQHDVVKQAEVVKRGNEKLEKLLEEIHQSSEVIQSFSKSLKEHITSTEQISTDITQAFTEMAKGVEKSSSSVSDIHKAASMTMNHMSEMRDSVNVMNEVSFITNETTKEGEEKITELVQTINEVHSTIANQNKLVQELYNESKEIGNILASIRDISEQTNLLALNASIEAARAGEHGKGFAVVADEVRKLAENSQVSTNQISNILNVIHEKIDEVKLQVDSSLTSVNESISTAKETLQKFAHIKEQADRSALQSKNVYDKVNEINETYEKIMDEFTSVTQFTEMSSASVEEVLASVEEQHERIQAMMDNFVELEKLTTNLNRLVNEETTN